jgi:hypothetical protein
MLANLSVIAFKSDEKAHRGQRGGKRLGPNEVELAEQVPFPGCVYRGVSEKGKPNEHLSSN